MATVFKTYGEKLKHPKWQRKRTEILQRDNFKCRVCADPETALNVHHLSYKGEPWEVDNEQLITLCDVCHLIVEHYKCLPSDLKAYGGCTEDGRLKIISVKGNIHLYTRITGGDVYFNIRGEGIDALKQLLNHTKPEE